MRPQEKPADSKSLVERKPTACSRITNGNQLFVGVDGRTRDARRWRDLFRQFMAETGNRNETLCRSLASMVIMREALDAALAKGEPVDPQDLIRVCGAISRLMTKLNLVEEPPPVHEGPAPPWVVDEARA